MCTSTPAPPLRIRTSLVLCVADNVTAAAVHADDVVADDVDTERVSAKSVYTGFLGANAGA